ncbi:hypothetical protein HPT27_16930 [Permianibacter sp. IMCC34836]|uniref:hypothetical protein n=1 Tax=Permianibacter fluminis TaxID=2738515 RepID=UPI00155182AA|nr:hypothetical protein [Permianibacter fluminis]NQD38710.1 hypothetical protein [Permianibacter fluminis]
MSIFVSRADVADILAAWGRGDLSAVEVHEWAEMRYWPSDLEVDDEEDEDNSVCREVLHHLDSLDMNLVIQEDIPAMLDFLSTPRGQFSTGYERWDRITKNIDYKKRMMQLREIEPYSPICK